VDIIHVLIGVQEVKEEEVRERWVKRGGHTVRVFKIDAVIQNAFLKCICGASLPQTGRLLPQIGRLLLRTRKVFPKKQKASSEEH